ncbi:MAG: hypothetical protein J0L53_13485, partial [Spirochaetes bacterium]|nr:hypothetical protein [Spirochaetota bacterium]
PGASQRLSFGGNPVTDVRINSLGLRGAEPPPPGKEEIVVNGVKFKNQPEVMAETIKQLMDQDKD